MKLYTEEQVRKAIEIAQEMDKVPYNDNDYTHRHNEQNIIQSLTPIELPDNDEDAGKIALYISSVRDEEKAVFIIAGAMKYNEWIRSKILNQNK